MALTNTQIKALKAKLRRARALVDAALTEVEEWLALNAAHAHFNVISGRREQLAADRAEISARISTSDARNPGFLPPSKAKVDTVVALSNQLQAEIRNSRAGSSVLAIATKAVELAAEAKTIGSA